MNAPLSLPQQLYLLAYDPRRQRLTGRFELRFALRAAALIQLLLEGQLEDHAGTVRVRPGAASADPALQAVLTQIAGRPPRSWGHWVRAGHRAILPTVQQQLVATGLVDLRPRPLIGRTAVTVPDLQPVLQMRDNLDGPLLALAITTKLPTVAARPPSPQTTTYAPVLHALRAAIRGRRAAAWA